MVTDVSDVIGGLNDATERFEQLVAKFAKVLVEDVVEQCTNALSSAQAIPRLYRRTNRAVRICAAILYVVYVVQGVTDGLGVKSLNIDARGPGFEFHHCS